MTPHDTRASTYHVVTAVWGEAFIDLFLNVCVPNQLTPGNLDALPRGSRYRVLTTADDAPRLAASDALQRVGLLLPVDIVEVDAGDREVDLKYIRTRHRYKMMGACHRRAIADAAEHDAAIFFLAPDFVLGQGALAAIRGVHETGKRAVLTANLRLCRERFVAELKRRGVDRPLPSRVLVGMALEHLHPAIEDLMVDGSGTDTHPTAVYWPVRTRTGKREGLLVRAFHLHPMLLDPVRRLEPLRGTIDGHYVQRCCPREEQVYVVQDSDEVVTFELTPEDRSAEPPPSGRGISKWRLAAVASECDRYQRSHWHRPIRLHAGDIGPTWSAVEAESERFVRDFEWYRPFGPTLSHVFRTYSRTQLRVQRRFRTIAKALRPRINTKRYTRAGRLLVHDVAKSWKLRVKQARRSVPVRWLLGR
jgi:hypothetical protein